MSTELACPIPPSPAAVAAMDLAALHLRRVADRLIDAAALARRLAASTDWQTPAARAFFALAEQLADDVGALGLVADAVRGEIALARTRITMANSWDCR